ncbi:hypothetical protein [Spirillospora sp. NPDC048819]|uniref:hypothetical protein n=1 Tax=Spirillospora sp. NPDC048819 TaxID=3155268 RepID=UPI0033CE51AD
MTDSNRGVVREIHWSNLAALFALAVVLVGTGAGFKWTGVLPTFAGFGRAPSTPLLEAAGIGVLFAGTGLAVHHAATRVEGFGGLFGRVWGGVFVTWTAVCGLVALVVAVTTGGYTAGGHLVAGVNGASVGVVRGVLFGWVVAVAAVVAEQWRRRTASRGVDAGSGGPVSRRRWRPGPYLILTGVIFGPLGAAAVWARLFLSPDRAPGCIDWCMSDREGVFFLLFLAANVAIPVWALLMGTLGALRLIPAVRSWPVFGQVAAVLTIGAGIGGPVAMAWLTG